MEKPRRLYPDYDLAKETRQTAHVLEMHKFDISRLQKPPIRMLVDRIINEPVKWGAGGAAVAGVSALVSVPTIAVVSVPLLAVVGAAYGLGKMHGNKARQNAFKNAHKIAKRELKLLKPQLEGRKQLTLKERRLKTLAHFEQVIEDLHIRADELGTTITATNPFTTESE